MTENPGSDLDREAERAAEATEDKVADRLDGSDDQGDVRVTERTEAVETDVRAAQPESENQSDGN
jgi:hypothetical protein